MPRVSVVVPTYDRAETLPRAVDSALAQTVDDIEVIVVDDGSTDDTPAVLASYDDPRLRTVVHATNRGANVARNTGIEHARGEYVAFLDSDDWWRPEKLEHQLAALETRSDEWVGAYCDSTFEATTLTDRVTHGVASLLARTDDDDPPREGGEALVGPILADEVQPGAGSTLLVRTDVARSVGGFDESLDRFQDPEFVLRILSAGKLAYVDAPLVVRENTGTPPADVVRRADEQYLGTYEETVDRLEEEGYAIRASHALVLAKLYAAEGRLLRSVWHLRRAAVSLRHVPGLIWAAGTGVRRRPLRVAATFVLVASLTVFAASAVRSRLR